MCYYFVRDCLHNQKGIHSGVIVNQTAKQEQNNYNASYKNCSTK